MSDILEKSAYARIAESARHDRQYEPEDEAVLEELKRASEGHALDEEIFIFYYEQAVKTITKLFKHGFLESPLTEDSVQAVYVIFFTIFKTMNIVEDAGLPKNNELMERIPFLPYLAPDLAKRIFLAACQDAEIELIRERIAESGLVMGPTEGITDQPN
ncbi:hypothetical protein HN709_04550 [Candidatus Peregrinibacteria bacterium]|jgi:hypothetical protein|nr:hypothetical protein [Candidatus Peregrinibacteria bacterium]MBT7736934.1 hypothetical protein [Candidatus Peregrinibacteria bacterium]